MGWKLVGVEWEESIYWCRISFLFCYVTFIIILKFLLFCLVPGFLLTFRMASYAPNLLLMARPRNSLVLCLLFQAASPAWIFGGHPSLLVREDTVSPAYCFLPDTDDRHINHLCFQVFVVNHYGDLTKVRKNINGENDTKVTKPHTIFMCLSYPILVLACVFLVFLTFKTRLNFKKIQRDYINKCPALAQPRVGQLDC